MTDKTVNSASIRRGESVGVVETRIVELPLPAGGFAPFIAPSRRRPNSRSNCASVISSLLVMLTMIEPTPMMIATTASIAATSGSRLRWT